MAALWLVASCLAFALALASESILDMIDQRAVQRVVAQRRSNASREFLAHNSLGEREEESAEPPRRNVTDVGQLQELLRRHGDLLTSSQAALLVTKKQYLRQDWCKSQPLLQVIQEEGCTPVSFPNRFCYGQCNSFYIPKGPKRKGKAGKVDDDLSAFKSCAYCRPKLSSWITVTLRCRKKKKTVLRRKKVLRIKQCKCIAQGDD